MDDTNTPENPKAKIDLDIAKRQLRIYDDSHNNEITNLIEVAYSSIESRLRRSVLPRTDKTLYANLPTENIINLSSGDNWQLNDIVNSVVVSVVGTDDSEIQVITQQDYYLLKTPGARDQVFLRNNLTVSTEANKTPMRMKFVQNVGFAEDDIPVKINQAVKMMIVQLFDNPSGSVIVGRDNSTFINNLLADWRVV